MRYPDFYQTFRKDPVLNVDDIRKVYSNFDTRRLVEWQKKGYINKIRNRYYTFSDRKIDENYLYKLSNEIYGPSYISLQSAMGYYNFIPEGVFLITAVSTNKTNRFKTTVGNFSYRHIKSEMFFEYRLHEVGSYTVKFAEPEKALLDMIYLNKDLDSSSAFESERWNAEIINRTIDQNKLGNYVSYIGSKALSERVNQLNRFLHAGTG